MAAGNADPALTFQNDIPKVTAADLLRVARKYLSPQTLSAIALTNDEANTANEQLVNWTLDYKKKFSLLINEFLSLKIS